MINYISTVLTIIMINLIIITTLSFIATIGLFIEIVKNWKK